ncbi:p21-C-terminal region-binding protein-domain-containing protein [Lasiosphaeria miniovina]|uniref:Protein BCP1 n=1 Tax=Lasiosphaeria miniovina TaxID=1954250 RepID=A0AA40AU88_9PEZI|nr:p21-C-terminal region-binding protein-domain-containing protein [Lasiosphaeria miniovina]KAK0722094.1 p21-C-terminal region-binding protein-domain-containing protein [Lasiosphaeria miniovina]
MGKKRTREAEAPQQDPTVDKMDEDGSSDSSDDDMDIVNVDFELFNYDSQIDFHGVKTLLRQLFDADAQLLDLSGLSDLIVEQNTIGSTCKVDDKANDAYAFLTVLNLTEHRAKKPVAQLIDYLSGKARVASAVDGSSSSLAATVPELLAAASSGSKQVQVGLVLAERLLNMPAEVIPPMWGMLVDEIEAAVEDKEPYEFTHYVVVSRAYREVASSLDQSERKQKKAREESKMLYFHPEDDEMRKHAAAAGAYAFTSEESVADSKRAFQDMGVQPQGFMMLIEASKFEGAVKAIRDYVGEYA